MFKSITDYLQKPGSNTNSDTSSIKSDRTNSSIESTATTEIQDPIERKKYYISEIFNRISKLNKETGEIITNKGNLSDKKKFVIKTIDEQLNDILEYYNDIINETYLNDLKNKSIEMFDANINTDYYNSLITRLTEIYNSVYFKKILLNSGEDDYLLSEIFEDIKIEFINNNTSDQINNKFLKQYNYTYIGGINDNTIKDSEIIKKGYVDKEIELSKTGCCFEHPTPNKNIKRISAIEQNDELILEFNYNGKPIKFYEDDFNFVLINIDPKEIENEKLNRGDLDYDPHGVDGGKPPKKSRKPRRRLRKTRKNRKSRRHKLR